MFTDNELELGGYQQHEWKQNCVRRGDNDFQSRFILSMGVWEEGRARSRADDEMRDPYCYPFLWHIFLLFHDTHRPSIMTFSCCLFLAEIANLLSVAVVVVQEIDKQRKTSREFKLVRVCSQFSTQENPVHSEWRNLLVSRHDIDDVNSLLGNQLDVGENGKIIGVNQLLRLLQCANKSRSQLNFCSMLWLSENSSRKFHSSIDGHGV